MGPWFVYAGPLSLLPPVIPTGSLSSLLALVHPFWFLLQSALVFVCSWPHAVVLHLFALAFVCGCPHMVVLRSFALVHARFNSFAVIYTWMEPSALVHTHWHRLGSPKGGGDNVVSVYFYVSLQWCTLFVRSPTVAYPISIPFDLDPSCKHRGLLKNRSLSVDEPCDLISKDKKEEEEEEEEHWKLSDHQATFHRVSTSAWKSPGRTLVYQTKIR